MRSPYREITSGARARQWRTGMRGCPYIGHVPEARSLNPFRVFQKHRNFRLFLIGQTLSLVGTWMQTIALGWLALVLTNSAFLFCFVVTALSVWILIISLPAGTIYDRSHNLLI